MFISHQHTTADHFFTKENCEMLISQECVTTKMHIRLKEQQNADFTKLLRLVFCPLIPEVQNTTNHADLK